MRSEGRLGALAAWTRGDWLLAGGVALAAAGAADLAATIRTYLSFSAGTQPPLLERTQFVAWNMRASVLLASAVGALLVLGGLLGSRGALGRFHERVAQGLVALAALESAFCLAVFGFAIRYANEDAVDSIFGPVTGADRAATLTTHALTFLPLAALLALVALRALPLAREAPPELEPEPEPQPEPEPPASAPPVTPAAPAPFREPVAAVPGRPPRLPVERPARAEEMEHLWRERLAFSPNREEARQLLEQVRRFAELGDDESVRRLAEQLERL
jgi:hypothetical protein